MTQLREVMFKKVRIEPHQKCPRCEYEWESKSTLQNITCPNCRKLFRRIVGGMN